MVKKKLFQSTQADSLERRILKYLNKSYFTIDSDGKGRDYVKIRNNCSAQRASEIINLLNEAGVEPSTFTLTSHIIQIKRSEDIEKLVELAGPAYKKYKFYKEWKKRKELFKP